MPDQILRAQDIHFSQIHSVPLLINAANTGIGDEDFRFSNDYRNQWRQIDYPFQTLCISFDKKQLLFSRLVGFGATVIHDQSAGTLLSSDKIYISVSHSFFHGNNQFIIGLQPGVVFRYLNMNELTFGSQFDPVLQRYNSSLANNEGNLEDNTRFFDLNAGILWRTRIKNIQSSAGFAVQHLTRPDQSFTESTAKSHLPLIYNIHGNMDIPFLQHFELSPLLYYSYSNGVNELMTGLISSYYPEDPYFSIQKIYLVSTLRSNPFTNFDAFILGAGCKVLNFNLCFTYDFTVSKLRKASNVQGAFEISIIYTNSPHKNKKKSEPCFML